MFSRLRLFRGRNAIERCGKGVKKPRKLSRFSKILKSCFGYGSIENGLPSRNEYQRAREPATGFAGEEVYGIQAEYLDEDNMAWGMPRRSRKQAQRNRGLFS